MGKVACCRVGKGPFRTFLRTAPSTVMRSGLKLDHELAVHDRQLQNCFSMGRFCHPLFRRDKQSTDKPNLQALGFRSNVNMAELVPGTPSGPKAQAGKRKSLCIVESRQACWWCQPWFNLRAARSIGFHQKHSPAARQLLTTFCHPPAELQLAVRR